MGIVLKKIVNKKSNKLISSKIELCRSPDSRRQKSIPAPNFGKSRDSVIKNSKKRAKRTLTKGS
jgi:hypothetical protein